MGKLFKLLTIVFAIIGVLVTLSGGIVIATNTELASEFWGVRNEFNAVPAERKQEVLRELPARISFEREVGEDMTVLPQERQTVLYKELASSRDMLFVQFKERIAAEAKIIRETEDAKKAIEKIKVDLGEIAPEISIRPSVKRETPKAPPLAGVESASMELMDANGAYYDARGDDGSARVEAAVGVLKALDKLASEIEKARGAELNENQRNRLDKWTTSAKKNLVTVKQTPGIENNAEASRLMKSIPEKLAE